MSAQADHVAPVITLKGSKSETITLNTAYADPGATAIDDVDGNLDAAIVTSGIFNTNSATTYVLTYTVKDAAGNAAVAVTRTLQVINSLGYLDGSYTVDCNCNYPLGYVSGTYTTSVGVSKTENYGLTVFDLKGLPVLGPHIIRSSASKNNTFDIRINNNVPGTLTADKTSFTLQTVSPTGNQTVPFKTCNYVFKKL